jgi:hypothetical protein
MSTTAGATWWSPGCIVVLHIDLLMDQTARQFQFGKALCIQHLMASGMLLWISEGKFGVSLTEHKTHVKKLIKEEISKLAEKEDDEPETEVGAGSQAEAEGEAEPRADAEAECEPARESELETAPEAVAELKATPEQKPEPKQEERSEIQTEAEVEAKASPRGEAEVSQQVAPEVKTDVTEEVEDMVLEPGTTQKPGREPTPTVVADTKENAQLDVGTELELKTAANETERI